jgi:hypothetical protein
MLARLGVAGVSAATFGLGLASFAAPAASAATPSVTIGPHNSVLADHFDPVTPFIQTHTECQGIKITGTPGDWVTVVLHPTDADILPTFCPNVRPKDDSTGGPGNPGTGAQLDEVPPGWTNPPGIPPSGTINIPQNTGFVENPLGPFNGQRLDRYGTIQIAPGGVDFVGVAANTNNGNPAGITTTEVKDGTFGVNVFDTNAPCANGGYPGGDAFDGIDPNPVYVHCVVTAADEYGDQGLVHIVPQRPGLAPTHGGALITMWRRRRTW